MLYSYTFFGKNLLLNCREAVMEDMADRHVLSKNYTRWKMMYEMEQRNGVASLHYKYVIFHTQKHSPGKN